MPAVKGIGFDLFGTLVLQERFSFDRCIDALCHSLVTSGFALEKGPFLQVYREVNRRLMDQATAGGRETHNRLWVAGALQTVGYAVAPTDACIEAAVNAYFEPFIKSCQLVPGTYEMLDSLRGQYHMALVSNFTHPPAVADILERVGIAHFFGEILVSGQLGFRKPHPAVFAELQRRLRVEAAQIIFVGDELLADVVGAQEAGMRTVWMTYRQKLERPAPHSQFLGISDHIGEIRPDYVVESWSEFLAILG